MTKLLEAILIEGIESGNDVQIWRCPLPLPNALRAVNGYLMRGGGEVVAIDPGFHNEETIGTWERHLAKLSLRWEDITSIVVTHYHPDHCGLAGWMQRKTKAPVWISQETRNIMKNMWGVSEEFTPTPWEQVTMPTELSILFSEHGMPDSWGIRMMEHFHSFQELVTPQPIKAHCLDLVVGAKIELAGLAWSVLKAEGHASGQRMLWQAERGWMFCADHVLPDISPNISVLVNEDANPLETYMQDLQAAQHFQVKRAFPGHRGVITRWEQRIQELLDHHEMRLEQISRLVRECAPVQAWTLVPKLYNKIETDQQMRFAFAEMIAHLWYLECEGTIFSERKEASIWFS